MNDIQLSEVQLDELDYYQSSEFHVIENHIFILWTGCNLNFMKYITTSEMSVINNVATWVELDNLVEQLKSEYDTKWFYHLPLVD